MSKTVRLADARVWDSGGDMERVAEVVAKYEAVEVPVAKNGLSDLACTEQMRQCIQDAVSREDDTEDDSFYLIDIGTVEAKMRDWREQLPRVRPFYAYKCNGNPALIETLAALGAGFDCASKGEIDDVVRLTGVDAEKDIIFANPCKQVSHCRTARKHGVRMVTYDNEHELPKIKQHWPEAKVLLRIATDDSASICELSSKYGAAMDRCPGLIAQAQELGLELVGVSFHVGSGCGDAGAFVKAAQDARKVFDIAEAQGVHMSLLDIGGGFPGDDSTTPSFADIADALRPTLDKLFPDTELIAEPGRYFACASHSLCANIFSKRVMDIPAAPNADDSVSEGSKDEEEEVQYYINEGLYQSFNCMFYDHAIVTPRPLRVATRSSGDDASAKEPPSRLTTIFGPTCDGLDCVAKRIPDFPNLDIGDWLYFRDFGAYTIAGSSAFNGFQDPHFRYVRTVPSASHTDPISL